MKSSSFGKARRDTGRWWDTPEKGKPTTESTIPSSPTALGSPRRNKSQSSSNRVLPQAGRGTSQPSSPHLPRSSGTTNPISYTKKNNQYTDKDDDSFYTGNNNGKNSATEMDLNRLEDFARSLIPSSSTFPNTVAAVTVPFVSSSATSSSLPPSSFSSKNNPYARASVSHNDSSFYPNEEKKNDDSLLLSSSSPSSYIPPPVPYVSPLPKNIQIPMDPIMAQDDKDIAKVLAGVENLWALAATTELSLGELAMKKDDPIFIRSSLPSNPKKWDTIVPKQSESVGETVTNSYTLSTNHDDIPPPPRTPPLPTPVYSLSSHATDSVPSTVLPPPAQHMMSPVVADYLGSYGTLFSTNNTIITTTAEEIIPSVRPVTPPLPPVLLSHSNNNASQPSVVRSSSSLSPPTSKIDSTTSVLPNPVSEMITNLIGSNVSSTETKPNNDTVQPSVSFPPSSSSDMGLLVREPSTVGETGLSSNPAGELAAEPTEQPDISFVSPSTSSSIPTRPRTKTIVNSNSNPTVQNSTEEVSVSATKPVPNGDFLLTTDNNNNPNSLSPSKTIESLLQKYSGTIQKLSSLSSSPVPSGKFSSSTTAGISISGPLLYRADETLTRVTTYLKEITILRTIADEAKAALATATIAVRTTAEEATRLRTERDQLLSQIHKIEEERSGLRSALTQSRQQISSHNTEMSRLQQELDSTKRMLRPTNRSNEDAVTRLQIHIEKLYKESNELRNKASDYGKQLTIESQGRSYAEKELSDLQGELTKARNIYNSAKMEADSARSESTRLRAKMEGLTVQTEGFQKRIKDTDSLLLEIEADNVKTKAEAASEINTLKQQLADVSTSIATTLLRNKEESDATVQALRTQIQEMQQRALSEVQSLQQDAMQLRNKLFTTEKTVEELTKDRDDKVTEITSLNEQIEHLKTELRSWGPGRPIAEVPSSKSTTGTTGASVPVGTSASTSSSSLLSFNPSLSSSVNTHNSSLVSPSTPVLYNLTSADIDNLPILEKELHALRSEVAVHRFTVASLFRIALEAAHVPPEYNISELWRNLPGDLGDLAYQAAANYQTVAAYKLPAHASTTSTAEYSNVTACVLNAQASFAWCAETGFGLNRDLIAASQYYRYAAESGLVSAQFQLGLFNQYTNTVNIDKYQAALWYQKAAESGHAGAAKALGLCYQLGIGGVKQDPTLASEWLKKATELRIQKKPEFLKKGTETMVYIPIDASDQHNAELVRTAKYYQTEIDKNNQNASALTALGKCYEIGEGVPFDTNMAVMYYRKAAEMNYAPAQYELGICFRDGIGLQSNTVIAADWFRRSAKQEHAGAAYALGQLYAVGDGVELDIPHAVTWYIIASNGGDVRAMCTLASCYEKGEGVSTVDYDQALYWYRKAAEKNYPLAQFNIGVYYRDGKGVPKDTLEALSWFRRAADQGYPPAQWSVGMCFEWGVGLPAPDFVQAFRWFQRSAEAGCAIAQYSMAHCYRHGKGVEPNAALADMWYKRAAEGGGLVVL